MPVEAPEVVGIGVGMRRTPGRGAGSGRARQPAGAGPGADLPDADQPGAVNTILTRIRRGP